MKENTWFQIKSYLNLFKTFRFHTSHAFWIFFSFISFVTVFTTNSRNELNTFHFLAHFPSHFDLINCIEICALILCIYFNHFGWIVAYLFKLNATYRILLLFEIVFIDNIEWKIWYWIKLIEPLMIMKKTKKKQLILFQQVSAMNFIFVSNEKPIFILIIIRKSVQISHLFINSKHFSIIIFITSTHFCWHNLHKRILFTSNIRACVWSDAISMFFCRK